MQLCCCVTLFRRKFFSNTEQCDEQTCQFGGRCEERDGSFGCVCDTECTTEYLPVCGSDSVTYSNNCSMMGASCRKQQEIRRVMDGECASTCMSYGINFVI